MARQTADLEDEFETEYESEFETEDESEWEDEWEEESEYEEEYEDESEEFFPGLGGVVNAIGGMLGEEEYEWEDEGEDEYEDEAFLGLLGPIAKIAGGLLGGGGGDSEYEDEYEYEEEAEAEAEEFFKRLKGAFRKAAPFLKRLAKTAGPLVATAIGGPAAGAVARAVTSQLEGEFEEELEVEFEEMARTPLVASQTFAEYLAGQAAATESESEAEALGGAAAYAAINPGDRRELERLLPHLLRGAATLTRMLHGNRSTRPAVRLVPGIADGAARTVAKRIAAGEPVGPVELGQVMGAAATQALTPGSARQAVLRRHARGLARSRRRYHGPGRRGYGRRTGMRRPGTTGSRYGARRATVRRQPVRSRTVGSGRVPRPKPGFVRITTPLRVPPKAGRPARVVRVVSDVRVPRGAVPAGRPSAAGRRR
ncbi:hypothetical protein [Kribbella sp. VKM Ac-2568]|uniref:hypothetical protein n=1 Tax=Kribbella sp. VKM Ac-2568 TaxID=2512219 RepID=UPI0010433AD6|nr:hypothetical protein [Kribbella sp. VKM Ac-2568]TCM48767.1 hypothetical protein EV648_10331 [Kribbella sp. VKM Ac-2568]